MKTREPTPACFASVARFARHPASFALAIAVALTGCATNHQVRVDSLARPRAGTASYVLKAAGPLAEADSLRAQELAAQVRVALGSRGLHEAPSNTTPDIVVELDCGVNSLPMQLRRLPGPLDRIEPWVIPSERVQAGVDEEGKPIYVKREIIKTPGGYFELVPMYEKYLRISAHENAAPASGRPPAEVWRVDASVEGESQDLRKALPVLVTATIEQIGNDSHGQKTVRIRETSARMSEARRGL